MRLVDGRPLYAPTDLASYLACEHLLDLEARALAGNFRRPFRVEADRDLLERRGLEHERAQLARLTAAADGRVADLSRFPPSDTAAVLAATLAAMKAGVAVIYQGALRDGDWLGRPDFLVRVATPSLFGGHSYEAVDTKLARRAKARAVLQLGLYSELLARAQDRPPVEMRLVLGDGREEALRVEDYLAYVRAVRRRFEAEVARQTTSARAARRPAPEPVDHCGLCDWQRRCEEEWRARDHLSLVAGSTRRQRGLLGARGVDTLAKLAVLEPAATPKVPGLSRETLLRLSQQARLQAAGRAAGKPLYELLPCEEGRGLARLPPPSPDDLFFDMEGDPYALEGGLEYLFGVVCAPGRHGEEPRYLALRGLDRAGERRAFEAFMDLATERLERGRGMHVYHYNHYEPTALKRLVGRHRTREAELDRMLRAGVFVDLYQVVRQGLRASAESYSLKRLEPLYGFARRVPMQDANASLRAFERWLEEGGEGAADASLLTAIEGYNRDDCESTLRLRDWLEARRTELQQKTGKAAPRPLVEEAAPDAGDGEGRASRSQLRRERLRALAARLVADVPEDPGARGEEDQARALLASLLEWHRRETNPAWWEYFRLRELDEEGLLEDRSALGGLEPAGAAGAEARSELLRYRFPPQPHAIEPGTSVRDPVTGASPGEVVAVDDVAGTIDLKRRAGRDVPHPRALVPFDVVEAPEQEDSLRRLAEDVLARGARAEGPLRAARALLLAEPPRCGQERGAPLLGRGEEVVAGAVRLVRALEGSVLPVQGPPGAGKTFIGARMIVALLRAGKRVGVTANSHKVIGNLLEEALRVARAEGVPVRCVQKAAPDQALADPDVQVARTNLEIEEALAPARGANLIAGTSWLWAREAMTGAVDVLFVDEAGQLSLANALAVASAADALVLLGDPGQLDQPQKGAHPPGAERSALEHLLQGAATVPPARGIFLDRTWRLHPDVCAFTSSSFYEGRLRPVPALQNQAVRGPGRIVGTGLRFVPVEHAGNASRSEEEAAVVAALFAELTDGAHTWRDRNGVERRVGQGEILVVAPYNAQVSLLRARLPEGARIGTVDRFQGQEAPIVLYSLATSTAAEAPRGMEFLYSRNRLNVATSRARCLAVLVASPALVDVLCSTPRQMRLVNAFCRFLELATPLSR